VERDAFLAGIRERLAQVGDAPLPDALPPTFASGDGRLADRFVEQLASVGGEARRVHTYEVADAVAEISEGCRTAVVAAGVAPLLARVEEGLRRSQCRPVAPERDAVANADLGITTAELGVASTGSVLVPMGPEAHRSISLLPPTHLVLLPEERLVPGFEELFARMPELANAASQTVLITGPSRTSDIERQLVWGVHGPIRVVVLIVAP
jgi:L-lactate dehydrogenase complex protein LldG